METYRTGVPARTTEAPSSYVTPFSASSTRRPVMTAGLKSTVVDTIDSISGAERLARGLRSRFQE